MIDHGHSSQRRREEAGDGQHEPPRLMAGAPRGSALAVALGAAQASGPSVEQLRALEARVLAGVGVATVAAASVASVATANQGTQAVLGLGHSWLAALPGKIAIGLVVAAAGAGGTVVALKRGAEPGVHQRATAVASRSAPARTSSSLAGRPIAGPAPVASAPSAAPEPSALAPAPPVAPPIAAAATSAPGPRLAPAVSASSSRSRPVAPRATGHAPSSSIEELRLLDLADAAVQSDPSLALRLTEQHARRYPSGLLGDERDVIEIAALVRLGRRDAAQTKAWRFLGTHPGSAYSAKVRALTSLDADRDLLQKKSVLRPSTP
jgi:hypothetical protein